MVPDWAKNILFLLVYMISGLILVIIIEGLMSGSELIPLNTVIEKLVTHLRTPFLTSFLVAVTKVGNPFILSSATVLIAIILIMKGRYYDALVLAVCLAVAVFSLAILKHTFQITRPDSDISSVDGWSFPSGHATVATTFFFMLVYTFLGNVKTLGNKIGLVAGSIIGIFLISFSRLYLGAHWTLDILAGMALGMLSISFTILIFNIFFYNKRSLKNRIS